MSRPRKDRPDIIAFFQDNHRFFLTSLARTFGITQSYAWKILRRMVKMGQVRKVQRGIYEACVPHGQVVSDSMQDRVA